MYLPRLRSTTPSPSHIDIKRPSICGIESRRGSAGRDRGHGIRLSRTDAPPHPATSPYGIAWSECSSIQRRREASSGCCGQPTTSTSKPPRSLVEVDNTHQGAILVYIGIETTDAAMSKNTSISLGAHFEEFVGAQVADGRYGSVSEVVRAGLRLLEEHETRLKALRAALVEGEESGVSDRSVDEIFMEARKRHEMING